MYSRIYTNGIHNYSRGQVMSIRSKIRHGKGELVVTGTSKSGFRLASRDGAGGLSAFGPTYAKQKDAIAAGEVKFRQTAKITRPRRAA